MSKKFNKMLVLVVSFIMVFSTLSYADSNNNAPEEMIQRITRGVSTFSDWNEGKISQTKIVYDEHGIKKYKLHIVKNQEGSTAGYLINDISNGTIVEFSHGESPFETYLEEYLEKKGINNVKTKEKIKLVQNGIFQGYTIDDFETIIYFTTDTSISIDYLREQEAQVSEKNIESDISVNLLSYTESIIPGVPYNLNINPRPACGPVSGINIVQYWDKKGFGNLVTTQNVDSIYNLLYYYMGSFHLWDGQHATSPIGSNGGPYGQGLIDYFDYVGNYNLNVTSDFNITTSDYTSLVKYEVDRNRPSTILYHDYNGVYDSQYGLHYTTLVGYAFGSEIGGNYYIIHDLWSTNPIYRNWDNDVTRGDIWATFKIIPSN